MGYYCHHVVVVVVHDVLERGHAQRIYEQATEIWARSGLTARPMISAPGNNNTITVVCPSDGSKEGMPASDRGEAARAEFVRWLRENDESVMYWVELHMDEGGGRLVADSDIYEEAPDA